MAFIGVEGGKGAAFTRLARLTCIVKNIAGFASFVRNATIIARWSRHFADDNNHPLVGASAFRDCARQRIGRRRIGRHLVVFDFTLLATNLHKCVSEVNGFPFKLNGYVIVAIGAATMIGAPRYARDAERSRGAVGRLRRGDRRRRARGVGRTRRRRRRWRYAWTCARTCRWAG